MPISGVYSGRFLRKMVILSLKLKGWSGVYLFGGVRYNYGYNAKVFIMDDTGLWLPYPQELQAQVGKNNPGTDILLVLGPLTEPSSVKEISPSDPLCWRCICTIFHSHWW